ncbi:hypothetical protein HGRIS_010183 [Hohenbuehelia grisea]|uniref:Uncharacterized protein n=1 Tax=Hohenbuehelia grisea TaxID=104357 RepID=A0ABR3J3W7_9AGAR
MGADYKADPHRIGRSTQQQFTRLKGTYQGYVRQLRATGGGMKDGEDADNLIDPSPKASFQEEWPFWNDLHAFWRQLPNYNPVAVTTSSAGQNFAEKASVLGEAPGNPWTVM